MSSAGPTRCGSSAGASASRTHVRDEEADQDDRVEQRDRALQRQRQRVERRDGEERDLDRVRSAEPDAREAGLGGLDPAPAAGSVPGDEHDAAPSEADQQTIGAGHVRQRQRARGGESGLGARARLAVEPHRLAALPGEHEVDRVFGQDRDEREQREGQSGRDVELRHLGRPGQDECGADDRETEQHRLEPVREVRLGPADPQGGDRRQQGETEDESNASERGGGLRGGRHRLWRP